MVIKQSNLPFCRKRTSTILDIDYNIASKITNYKVSLEKYQTLKVKLFNSKIKKFILEVNDLNIKQLLDYNQAYNLVFLLKKNILKQSCLILMELN